MKYSTQQIILHWLSAIIIIWATLSGFYVAFCHPDQPVKEWIGFFNVSLTTLFIPFFILRVWYLFRHGSPAESLLTPGEQRIAHLGHLALYANISVVLITGVLMMNHAIDVFHMFHVPQPLHSVSAITFFNQVHFLACMTLALLIAGHILAVLKHQLNGKHILRNMCP
ncbi:cytochrome b [Pantoea eucrina]|uniref:cytochrome b n=1 Tax=Pantoea eucrina TaxID=472693 RepID=UPI002FDA7E1F